MEDITFLLAQHFGVVSSKQLRQAGLEHHDVERLIKRGALIRVRHGWYSGPDAEPLVVRAVRAGGVLSGPAALKLHGVWTPPDQKTHVRLRRPSRHVLTNATQDLTPFTLPEARAIRLDHSVDQASVALLTSMLTCSRDTNVVLTDSILNRKILTRSEVEVVAELAGKRGNEVMKLVSDSADSGSETLFRLWLIRNKIAFKEQVWIPMVGRVDFLIGDRLVIEIDSRAHHDTPDNYANDRSRDRFLTNMGYRHIRITYDEVVYRLEEVGLDILALIRRDEHRGNTRNTNAELHRVRRNPGDSSRNRHALRR